MTELIASAASAVGVSPITLLMGSNAAMAAAIAVIYRDCRKDRAALWSYVKALKKQVSDTE